MKKPKEYLSNWMLLHAVVMIGAAAGYYFLYERWLLWALPLISFAAFLARTGIKMKTLPLSSPANWVTMLRLLGVIAVFYWSQEIEPLAIGVVAIAILILDWLDGWLAKKTGTESDAGALFDKEVDAIMVLILCFVLFEKERAGSWILLIGLLRYIYVAAIYRIRKERPEPRFRYGKWIAGIFISTLIAGFVFPVPYQLWALGFGSVLLVYSFARSAWYWFAPQG